MSPSESATNAADNALLKAAAAARQFGVPCLGDDMALFVDSLDGKPGLKLSRWAQKLGGWAAARSHLQKKALGSQATFVCGLALSWPNGDRITSTGSVPGHICEDSGSGPATEGCFKPLGLGHAISEATAPDRASHHPREVALRQLLTQLRTPQ